MRNMNKKTISMLALGLLLAGGAIGVHQAMAQSDNSAHAQISVKQETQDPLYKGSIAVDEAKYEDRSEQNESKALAGFAKITAKQAKQLAEAKVGGTATAVKLGNENGSLVYEVKVGNQEVKVDAGSGSILKVEQANNEKEKTGKETEKAGGVDKDNVNHQFQGQEQG